MDEVISIFMVGKFQDQLVALTLVVTIKIFMMMSVSKVKESEFV